MIFICQMIESKLFSSDLLFFQKTINLVYQINKFVKTEHQFTKNITEKILKHVKFVIEKYIQKFNESDKSVSHQQHVESRFQTSSLQFFSD